MRCRILECRKPAPLKRRITLSLVPTRLFCDGALSALKFIEAELDLVVLVLDRFLHAITCVNERVLRGGENRPVLH